MPSVPGPHCRCHTCNLERTRRACVCTFCIQQLEEEARGESVPLSGGTCDVSCGVSRAVVVIPRCTCPSCTDHRGHLAPVVVTGEPMVTFTAEPVNALEHPPTPEPAAETPPLGRCRACNEWIYASTAGGVCGCGSSWPCRSCAEHARSHRLERSAPALPTGRCHRCAWRYASTVRGRDCGCSGTRRDCPTCRAHLAHHPTPPPAVSVTTAADVAPVFASGDEEAEEPEEDPPCESCGSRGCDGPCGECNRCECRCCSDCETYPCSCECPGCENPREDCSCCGDCHRDPCNCTDEDESRCYLDEDSDQAEAVATRWANGR